MALRIYNTFSKQIEEFEPQDPTRVTMYNCGPTVYSDPHIGNFRSFLMGDLLRRYFERRGFEVFEYGVSPPPESEPDVEYRWRPSGDQGR